MKDEEAGDDEVKIEENTGVEFPGKSMEPMVGSTATFANKHFQSECFVAEI